MMPTVNKKLLPLKVHYFLKYGGIALMPFLPVVMRQKGVPDQGVGLMWTVTPLASAQASVTFGTLADAFKIHRITFLLGLVVLGASFTAMFFVPNIPWRETADPAPSTVALACDQAALHICPGATKPENSILSLFLSCDSGDTHNDGVQSEWTAGNCSIQCNVPHSLTQVGESAGDSGSEFTILLGTGLPHQLCHNGTCLRSSGIDPDSYFLDQHNLSCGVDYHASCRYVCGAQDHHRDSTLTHLLKTGEFWLMFVFLVLVYMANSTTTTMADAVCFYLLGADRHKYGHQRLWGSLSWGIVGMTSGALVDLYSRGQPNVNYTPALIIAVTFLSLNVFASAKIKFDVPKKEKLTASSMYNAFCTPRMVVFLLTVLVLGTTTGMQWTFLFIVVEDVSSAWDPKFAYTKLLQGLMVGIDCFAGDLPFLYISSYIIKRLGSIITFLMVIVVFSVRYLLYSAVTNPWYFLPVNLLHGLSFSVFYPNMMAYASAVAPRGGQAMMQGTVKSFFTGGCALGGLLGGTLMEKVGGAKTFLYMGLFLAGYTVFFSVVQLIIYKFCPEPSQDGRGEYVSADTDAPASPGTDVEAHTLPLQKTLLDASPRD